jgi:hypothetical protein
MNLCSLRERISRSCISRQTTTGEEHYSSLTEILYWIDTGPLLQPPHDPVSANQTNAPIITPLQVPATVQYVPTSQPAVITAPNATPAPTAPAITPWVCNRKEKRVSRPRPNSPDETPERQRVREKQQPQQIVSPVADWTGTNVSVRTQKRKYVPKVSDRTEKRVSLPRQAKNTIAYNVRLRITHDEHKPKRHVEVFRGLTDEYSEPPAPDPIGRAYFALTPHASSLSSGATSCELSHRTAGYIPIPYPSIPNETVDHENARFEKWCEDSEQRLQRVSRTSLFPLPQMTGRTCLPLLATYSPQHRLSMTLNPLPHCHTYFVQCLKTN